MKSKIQDLRAEIRSLTKLLADANALPNKNDFKPGEPIVLPEFLQNKDPGLSKQEINRINEQIDTRKMEIYEQRAPLK